VRIAGNTPSPLKGEGLSGAPLGTETLDRHYARYQARIDRLFAARGWREGRHVISRNFPGAAHNEQAWRARVDVPLRFLLPSGAAHAR